MSDPETPSPISSHERILRELAPPDYIDPVVEEYKKHIDRTLLRENLKLTVEERIRKAQSIHDSMEGWREAGRRLRGETPTGPSP